MIEGNGARSAHGGWWILVACFLCSAVVVGSTIYSFGVYVTAASESFGLGRAEANVGMMIFMSAGIVWSPLVGSALDRFPAPVVMTMGGVMLGVGLYAVSRSPSASWAAAAIAGPLALGMSAAGPLAGSTVVARWFRRRRGRAMGMVAVSTAAGGFVMAQVGGHLIPTYGWQDALAITGACGAAVISGLAAFVVRSRPDEAQLRAAGEIGDGADPEETADASAEWTSLRLISNRDFWLLGLGAGLLLGSDGAVLISKVPYLLDIGFDLPVATFLVACASASAIVGKLGVGFASERIDLRWLYSVVAILHLVLLGALLMKPGYWTLLVVFSSVGIAIGGIHPIFSTMIASVFGSRSYGAVHGRLNIITSPIGLLSIFVVGAVYDRTGNYDLAFWLFGGFVIVSLMLISALRLDRKHADEGETAVLAATPMPDPVASLASRAGAAATQHGQT